MSAHLHRAGEHREGGTTRLRVTWPAVVLCGGFEPLGFRNAPNSDGFGIYWMVLGFILLERVHHVFKVGDFFHLVSHCVE